MYILMAQKNGQAEQVGKYATYEEAFFAGMDGKGYCQFWIVDENEEQKKGGDI